MAGDEDQLNLLLANMSQQPADINGLLFSEPAQSQTDYYKMDEELQPSQQLRMFEDNANQELSIDEIQRILDLPSTALFNMTQNLPRKTRTESLCVSSPESGISGCDEPADTGSPLMMDQAQTMYKDQAMFKQDSGPVSFTPNETAAIYNMQDTVMINPVTSENYFEGVDMSTLLQLADESHQLMESSETDLQRLRTSNPYSTSPLITDRNPMFSQQQHSMQQPGAGVMRRVHNNAITITGPNHTTVSESKGLSPTPSVIVTNSNAYLRGLNSQPQITPTPVQANTVTYTYEAMPNPSPISSFSIPGQMIFGGKTNEPLGMDHMNTITPVDNSLPITVVEMDVPVVEVKPVTKTVKPKEEPNEYLCFVCGEKAGKHSYYGGQVCASCRAFFRRSVQSKYYEIFECKKDKNCTINSETRKNCQFCRFKKCLESGMKPSWVLSDEERNRRFNKFNKLNIKTAGSNEKHVRKNPVMRIPEIYMPFTIEEQKSLEDIHNKFSVCQKTWLKNLLLLDRNAGVNMIEAAFKVAPLKFQTWKVLEKAFQIYFSQNVVPKFIDVDNMSTHDKGQILNGQNTGMAHLFKSSQCLRIETPGPPPLVCKSETMCPMQKQVSDIVTNQEFIESLDLSQMMSRLNLAEVPKFPSYQQIFPEKWANNKDVEQRHMEIINRIQNWPRSDTKELDYNMVILMVLMLIFNADYEGLINKALVESVQLKYSMLLQRYLRSKMAPELANKKFLEAILLLSYTKEVWDMNKLYGQ